MLATFPGHGHSQAFNAPDDLPKTVTRTLNQGSSPMSMDFHPVQQTLLLGLSFNLRTLPFSLLGIFYSYVIIGLSPCISAFHSIDI